jgi:hypothetical protein
MTGSPILLLKRVLIRIGLDFTLSVSQKISRINLVKIWNAAQRYFTNTYRLELEANPQFSWHRADVVLRNRLELIKDERVPIIQKVYRARASIFYPLEGFGSLIGIGASEEVFYHFNQSRFTQSRFIPLELTFAEYQDHSISAFFMVRNFLSGTEWTTSWIFGTSLNF